MALILSLIRTAHARGTHHALALDALTEMQGPSALTWERLFYSHIDLYLDGAKAPDKAFKDFQNHVLHPRHNYWGGAPEQAVTWYGELVTALKQQDWPVAIYAAGVLSHYCTDPLQPLHTHQTEAENNIHAALEWTVSKSYNALRELGLKQHAGPKIEPAASDAWLTGLIQAGAARATAHYETLLAHYDFKRGVVAPEEGLDSVGQRAIAEMLVHASRLFATVLDRAVAEAAVTPPGVDLAGSAMRAFLSKPTVWWRKRCEDKADRKLIEAIYDELMTTGTVAKSLPEDEKMIRDAFARDVLAKPAQVEQPGPTRAPKSQMSDIPVGKIGSESTMDDLRSDSVEAADATAQADAMTPVALPKPRPAPPRVQAPPVRSRDAVSQPATEAEAIIPSAVPEPVQTQTPAAQIAAFASLGEGVTTPASNGFAPVQVPAPPSAEPASALSTYRPSSRTVHAQTLSFEADVVDAPSIGPKIAQKMNAVGIDTVGDFLKAHPIALASRLQSSIMTPDVLSEWQDQTRLMCELPDLRATQAKLLVSSGFKTVATIAAAEPDQMCADILRYALTPEGQRLLRDGHAPDIEQIRTWATNARAIKAA